MFKDKKRERASFFFFPLTLLLLPFGGTKWGSAITADATCLVTDGIITLWTIDATAAGKNCQVCLFRNGFLPDCPP